MDPSILIAVGKLLEKNGFSPHFEYKQLRGGSNNQVFCLQAGIRRVALKLYFHQSGDSQNRAKNEYEFARFIWDRGIRYIPQPFGFDPERHLALFEYVEGTPFVIEDITANFLEKALEFYAQLNSF